MSDCCSIPIGTRKLPKCVKCGNEFRGYRNDICDDCRPPIKVYFLFNGTKYEHVVSKPHPGAWSYTQIFEVASGLFNLPIDRLMIDGYRSTDGPICLFCLDEFREPSGPFKIDVIPKQ